MNLVYGFSNQWSTNISRRVLSELQKIIHSPDFIYLPINSYPQTFFDKYIKNNNYDLIIGLGDFYGNIHRIRLETVAHNNYLNKSIYPFSPINLELSLPILDNLDTRTFNVSEHMGNYNCNWMAYSIELYIKQHSPATRQLFFHLPKSQNATALALQIVDLLKNNQMLQ